MMRTRASLMAAMEVPRESTASYGVLDIDRGDGQLVPLRGMVETPRPEATPWTGQARQAERRQVGSATACNLVFMPSLVRPI
ncbi:hypothetical protein A9O63_07905 [Cereibacter johrii]|nr:hypothetical protein A9O63_07905 [Cereibacter johrii]